MEVILLERIERLGQMGDVVKVKPGYARNYLLPQKKALRANEENRKHFENQRTQLEAANLERRGEAEAVAEKLDGLRCVIIRQAGESGQLYGSVSARDIADTISEAGFSVTRQQILLAHNIKALGIYECRVVLHPEVIVTVSMNVARTEEEAKTQLAEALEEKKKEAEDQEKAEKDAAGEEKETGKKAKKKQSAEDEESEGADDSKEIEAATGDDAGAETSAEPSSGAEAAPSEAAPSESEATASPPEGDSPEATEEDKTG